jgi:hypothetical protein
MENADVAILAERLSSLHSDVSEIKSVMRDLTAAITQLALVEERQANVAAAQERMFVALERLEARIAALERLEPASTKTSVWVDRGVLFIIGAAATLLWEKIKGG